MTRSAPYRYVLDSLDDAGCAVLKRDDGLTFPVPAHWLPDGVLPGQRLEVRAEGGDAELTLRIVAASRPGG